jgi:hypothetical protein
MEILANAASDISKCSSEGNLQQWIEFNMGNTSGKSLVLYLPSLFHFFLTNNIIGSKFNN